MKRRLSWKDRDAHESDGNQDEQWSVTRPLRRTTTTSRSRPTRWTRRPTRRLTIHRCTSRRRRARRTLNQQHPLDTDVITRRRLCILIRLTYHLRQRPPRPSVLSDQRERSRKPPNGDNWKLMIKHDKTRRFRHSEKAGHGVYDGLLGKRIPVASANNPRSFNFLQEEEERGDALLVPNDGFETEYFFCDGSDAHIRVSIRWAPIPRYAPTCRVVNELHRPTQLDTCQSFNAVAAQCHAPAQRRRRYSMWSCTDVTTCVRRYRVLRWKRRGTEWGWRECWHRSWSG